MKHFVGKDLEQQNKECWDSFTSLLYHIYPFRYHHNHHLVLYRTHTDLTSSRYWHCKDGRSLYKVSRSWIICIWLPAKHLEVSSVTIYCVAPGHSHRTTIGYSCWNCIALVHWTSLSFVGAPVAALVSLWLSVLMLAIYLTCSEKFERTWEGFSLELFQYIPTDLKLALPSAAMAW